MQDFRGVRHSVLANAYLQGATMSEGAKADTTNADAIRISKAFKRVFKMRDYMLGSFFVMMQTNVHGFLRG